MNVQILQHVPFEDIGSMAGWLRERHVRPGYTRLFAGEPLPAPDSLDLVIVLGGPMSVNDERQYPWLGVEKAFLRQVLEAGIPMVGICLGAQLLASALGARVYPNRRKEIGWLPITATPAGEDAFRFPAETMVFHWHGETFDLPPGARLLASSAACRHQAFQLGSHVIGLQFHLETTPESLDAIIDNCRDELVAAPGIQDEATMRNGAPQHFAAINRLMTSVLEYVTRPA